MILLTFDSLPPSVNDSATLRKQGRGYRIGKTDHYAAWIRTAAWHVTAQRRPGWIAWGNETEKFEAAA